MNFRNLFVLTIFSLIALAVPASAQVDSVIGQITNSNRETFAGAASGDGRFVVFESRGNLASVNPRNADGNLEIFLFDYAQRRIFQITDTKSVVKNTANAPTFDNIKVEITNTRPVISNDGKWIAFSSNATTSTPDVPDATNPGSFDGNAYTTTTGTNPLTQDANTEMWLYQIPPYTPVDLTTGEELPVTDLSAGTFIRVTNTPASQLPREGTTTNGPVIADDNHDASISDDGGVIAFVSTRDLVPGGNPGPGPTNPDGEDNDEIFTFVRASSTISQVTQTPRGTLADPIYNKNVTISGAGNRVAFASTGDNPIIGMTGGNNPASSRNEEIFFSDLDANGAPTGVRKQVTVTTPTNPGDPVNILDIGRRMSRDGRYIAFDSYATLPTGANDTAFALYVYDTTADTFRQIGPRSNADAAASGGDIARYPGFTDTDAAGTPATLVLETRMNIKPDGTIPTNQDEGLNPNPARPAQLYSYPLNAPSASATFTRLTKLPTPNTFVASIQPLPSNSVSRIAFNLALSELGTGNFDLLSESYYMYIPDVTNQIPALFSYSTGASRMPVSMTPVPTPSPTPTPSPSPSPSPTPVTPPAVFGVSPGMLAFVNLTPRRFMSPIPPRTAEGSLQRSFQLPMELSGVTMSINGVTVGLKSVGGYQIEFVLPPALASTTSGTQYPVVINNNGTVIKTEITIVPARPDIFTFSPEPGPNGRAKAYNVINTVHRTEPFTVTTIQIRGGKRVQTVLRLHATGILNAGGNVFTVRIGSVSIPGLPSGSVPYAPGVQTIDFPLPASLNGAGDVPIILTITAAGVTFSSRLDDTAPRIFIL